MPFDSEWIDDGEESFPEEAKWEPIAPGVERLCNPDGGPVRTIGTGRRNHKVGSFYSYKMEGHVAHESEFECTLAKIFEVHPDVSRFYGQPETIRISTQGDEIVEGGTGPKLIYTPDFLTVFCGPEVRFEFKMAEALNPAPPTSEDDKRGHMRAEEAAKLRRKLRFVRQGYLDAGLNWICLTEIELGKMADATTIGDIISNGGREIEPDDLQRLVSFLDATPGRAMPLGRCEELITVSDFPRGAILARIPERIVHMDLDCKISAETLIHLTEKLA